jgi:hypothetical protein
MRASQLLFCAASVVLLAACTEPQCPPGNFKKGNRCYYLPEGGLDGGESDGEVLGADGGAPLANDGGQLNEAATDSEASVVSACPGACEAGKETSCTTSCGTQGTGMCTAMCGVPNGEQCTAPKEVCNWVDDDCDGVVDPGMLKQDTSATRVWTQEGAPTSGASAAPVWILPRLGGGAVLAYRGGTSGPIQMAALDEMGRKSPSTFNSSWSSEVTSFRVAGDGRFVAVASSTEPGANASDVKVHILNSSDLSVAGQLTLLSEAEPCRIVSPVAVGVQSSANGEVHIAVSVFVSDTLNSASGACEFGSQKAWYDVLFATLSPQRVWSPVKKGPELGSLRNLIISPLACPRQWLLLTNQFTGAGLAATWRRTSLDGTPISSPETVLTQGAVLDATTTSGDCAKDGYLALSFVETQGVTDTAYSFVKRWKVGSQSGQLTPYLDKVSVAAKASALLRVRASESRLWGIGLTDERRVGLYELPMHSNTGTFSLLSDTFLGSPAGGSVTTDAALFLAAAEFSAVGEAGAALVTSLAMLFDVSALSSRREPPESAIPAVLATQVLSCASQ